MSNYQLREGYKQTEIGVIPGEWEVKRLKHISPSQSVGLVINPSSYFDAEGCVPMLVGSHIKENYIDWELANKISNFSNNLLVSSRLAAGDIVTVRVGDPGLTAVIPFELDGCNCASMMIVRQHSSFVSHWLCYVMNSKLGRSQVEHVQYGTAQKQFNLSDAVNFLYPVPPIEEQRSLAQALSDVDALIAALDKLIAKKRDLKTATMQQLLTGKKRLPGFGEGKGYKESAIGLIPEDWEDKPLGSICKVNQGLQIAIESRLKNQTPNSKKYITIQSINSNLYSEYIESYSPSVCCVEDDILMTRTGNTGIVVTGVNGVFHNNFFKINFDVKRLDKGYIVYYLSSSRSQKIILEKAGTSTIPDLNHSDFYSIQIPLPEIEEQRAIATVLSDMDNAIAALESRLAKTQAIKQGMMQELLTGRTRLI